MNIEFKLTTSQEDGILLASAALIPWKMNVIAVSYEHKMFFIASKQSIFVYKINNFGSLINPKNPLRVPVSHDEINQIKVRPYNGEDYLIAVDDDDNVYSIKISLQKSYTNSGIQIFGLCNKPEFLPTHHGAAGTWSLDLNSKHGILAVGANSHKISTFDLKTHEKKREVFASHDNNIPSIQFSPCGNYIASISIDKSLQIFDVKTKRRLVKSFVSDYMWTVNWIQKNKVIKIGNSEDLNAKEYNRGMSTGLLNDNDDFGEVNLSDYLIVTTVWNEVQLFDLTINHNHKKLDEGFVMKPIECVEIKLKGINNMFRNNSIRLSQCRCLDKIGAVVFGMHHSREAFITKVFQSDYGYHLAVQDMIDNASKNLCLVGIEADVVNASSSESYDVLIYLLGIEKNFYKQRFMEEEINKCLMDKLREKSVCKKQENYQNKMAEEYIYTKDIITNILI